MTNPTPAARRPHRAGGVRNRKRPLKDYGPVQLGRRLGWTFSEVTRTVHSRLIPGPDLHHNRWSAQRVEQIVARVAAQNITPPPPFTGAHRAADYIRAAIDAPVGPDDVRALADSGILPVAGRYHGSQTYSLEHLKALRNDPAACRCIREALGYQPTRRPGRDPMPQPSPADRRQLEVQRRLRRLTQREPSPADTELASLRRLIAECRAAERNEEDAT